MGRIGDPAQHKKLAGAEGFEPPSPVLETSSLTVELTPLKMQVSEICGQDLSAMCRSLFPDP
jgi:hypothetical protein